MLWTKIVLALAGFALCFAEMLIPGFGIFGIAGVLCLTASVIMVGMEFGIGAFFCHDSRDYCIICHYHFLFEKKRIIWPRYFAGPPECGGISGGFF